MDDDKNKSDLPELPKPHSKKLGEDENKLDKRFSTLIGNTLCPMVLVDIGAPVCGGAWDLTFDI